MAAGTLLASSLTAVPASAAEAPAVAELVSPASGSTASTADVPLSPGARHRPGRGAAQVRFEGRTRGDGPGPGYGDPFTLVALPDTQNYTYLEPPGHDHPAGAVGRGSTRDALNTAFVVQLGDLVERVRQPHPVGLHLAGFGGARRRRACRTRCVPGNHDFNNATGAIPRTTVLPAHPVLERDAGTALGPSTAATSARTSSATDPVDRRTSTTTPCSPRAGRTSSCSTSSGRPRTYALDWARPGARRLPRPTRDRRRPTASSTINGNPPHQVAERPAATAGRDDVGRTSSRPTARSGSCSAATSHNGDAAEARRTDNNSCGQPVQQILSDYQDRAERRRRLAAVLHVRPGAPHDDRASPTRRSSALRDGRRLRLHRSRSRSERRCPPRSRRSRR